MRSCARRSRTDNSQFRTILQLMISMLSRNSETFSATIERFVMFDWLLDPRSTLALLCLATAFVYWSNDVLFFTFALLAVFTRIRP